MQNVQFYVKICFIYIQTMNKFHSFSSVDTDDKPTTSDTLQVSPMTDLAKKLSNFLTCRPIISQVFNFLRGFHLHRNYCENCDFTAWKGQNIIYSVKFSLLYTITLLNKFNQTGNGLIIKWTFCRHTPRCLPELSDTSRCHAWPGGLCFCPQVRIPSCVTV